MPHRKSNRGETAIVVLDFTDLGSLNLSGLEAAKQKLLPAILKGGHRTIEVDLKSQRVGAAFIGIVATANTMAVSRGRRLKLNNASPQIRVVLTLCGYDQLLDMQ